MTDQAEKNFSVPEPAPVANDNPAVWDLVIADVLSDINVSECSRLLAKDMQDRSDFGFKKYRTRLQTGNGRDHLIDLMQEVLDAIVYARAHMEEHGILVLADNGVDMEDVYLDLIDTAHNLRMAIHKRNGK